MIQRVSRSFCIVLAIFLSTPLFAIDVYKFKNGKTITESIIPGSDRTSIIFGSGKQILSGPVLEVMKDEGRQAVLLRTEEGMFFIREDNGVAKKIVLPVANEGFVFDLTKVVHPPVYLTGETFSSDWNAKKSKINFMMVQIKNNKTERLSVVFITSKGELIAPPPEMHFLDSKMVTFKYDSSKNEIRVLPYPEATETLTLGIDDGRNFTAVVTPIEKTGTDKSKSTTTALVKYTPAPEGRKEFVPFSAGTLPAENGAISGYLDESGKQISNIDEWMRSRFKFLEDKKLQPAEIEGILKDPIVRNIRIGLEGGSVVVLGESGSGKTETVERFISVMREGKFPELAKDKMVIVVDAQMLDAGTKYVGTFDARLKNLLQYAEEKNALVIIDELHSLKGTGTSSNKPVDVFQKIKTTLSKKKVKFIATDTTAEYYAHFSGDQAIIRRFLAVMKEEPVGEELLNIVKSVVTSSGRQMPDELVLKRAIQYSYDFAGNGAQPARALALLEYMYNAMKIDGVKGAPTLQLLEKTVVEFYKIDEAFVNADLKNDLLINLRHRMDKDLIGMEAFKTKLEDLTYQRYTGVSDPEKPAIRLFIAGPRGAGKTEGGLVYSKVMKQKVVRIEMNQFAHADPKEFLAKVAEALKQNSHATIIMDEFEKASVKVQDAALALLDSGRFSLDEMVSGSASKVSVKWDARKATIIATSNAGSDIITPLFEQISEHVMAKKLPLEEESRLIYELMDENLPSEKFESQLIKGGVSAPVLDRFQSVMAAYPATRHVFATVIDIHLDKLIQETEKRSGVILEITNRKEFVLKIVDTLYTPGVSNRYALRILQDVVRSQAAKEVFTKHKPGGVLKFALDLSRIKPSMACKQKMQKTQPSMNERTPVGFKFGNNK